MNVRIAVGAVIAVCVLAAGERVHAWGDRGHRIVARIAAHFLDADTKLRVRELLATDSCGHFEALAEQFACVASWADPPIKDQRPYTANWHFVDVPLRSTKDQPTSFTTVPLSLSDHCVMDPERGDCAVLALQRLQAVMSNPAEASINRLEALKFIVHIVGDLHQPMHCVTHQMSTSDHLGDLGGNFKAVQWLGANLNPRWQSQWNLHAVWDEAIIDKRVEELENEEKYLASLVNRASALPKQDFTSLKYGTALNWNNVQSWVGEGYGLAATVAYPNLPPYDATYKYRTKSGAERLGGYRLAEDYYTKAAPIVDEQLMRGGVRLAGYLERAFRAGGSGDRQ